MLRHGRRATGSTSLTMRKGLPIVWLKDRAPRTVIAFFPSGAVVRAGLAKLLLSIFLVFALSPTVLAQGPPLPSPLGAQMGTSRAPATGSILIYIRAKDGRPYSGIPQINLIVEEATQTIPQTPRM